MALISEFLSPCMDCKSDASHFAGEKTEVHRDKFMISQPRLS